MEFLEDNEICAWAKDHGLACKDQFRLALPALPVLKHYSGSGSDGRGRGAEVVEAVLRDLTPWDECVVIVTLWSVWPSSEDWPRVYAWRGVRGERRSLEVAPGHHFMPSEADLLRELLVLIADNGWDAIVLCARDGRATDVRATASHDGYWEILGTGRAG